MVTADRLILTKKAVAGADLLAQLLSDLRTINPAAEITAAEHGVPQAVPELPDAPCEPLPPLAGAEDLPPVAAMRTPAGRLLVQAVRRQVQAPEILPELADDPPDNQLVVLGRGCNAAQLARSLQAFST